MCRYIPALAGRILKKKIVNLKKTVCANIFWLDILTRHLLHFKYISVSSILTSSVFCVIFFKKSVSPQISQIARKLLQKNK